MLNGWVGPAFVDPQTPPYRFTVYSTVLLMTGLSLTLCVCEEYGEREKKKT